MIATTLITPSHLISSHRISSHLIFIMNPSAYAKHGNSLSYPNASPFSNSSPNSKLNISSSFNSSPLVAANPAANHDFLNSSSQFPYLQQFPVAGILPKSESQADIFLQNYPQFDGRGVVVAIFDTGVDPAAAGLQLTTEGKPKILDIIDCTGSGDVNTSTIVQVDENFRVTGLSGRKLQLNSRWNNPSGEFHIGMKALFELFPDGLAGRVKRERRKDFDVAQRELETQLQREIEANQADLAKKTELEVRLTEVKALAKAIEDVGPVVDVVCFFDGENWRVAIDKNESGDLTNAVLFTDFALERQFDTFSAVDMMSFSVNIYDEGNVVSIVTNAGAHGTHVAGIVAANYGENPALNGMAPGAHIISCKIGDSRLGSMETGVGLMRGLLAALRHNVDLINMSYGEAITTNAGRFMDFAGELINKHGIIFVSSAGNNGPGLSSVGVSNSLLLFPL
jgi:tripeptidyl-peptidase-2